MAKSTVKREMAKLVANLQAKIAALKSESLLVGAVAKEAHAHEGRRGGGRSEGRTGGSTEARGEQTKEDAASDETESDEGSTEDATESDEKLACK